MFIYKYALNKYGTTFLVLPRSFVILHVNKQNNNPYMWCLVDISHCKDPVSVYSVDTGEEVSFNQNNYIGTVVFDNSCVHHFSWTNNGTRIN
jgi:hypothetical protein